MRISWEHADSLPDIACRLLPGKAIPAALLSRFARNQSQQARLADVPSLFLFADDKTREDREPEMSISITASCHLQPQMQRL